MIPESNFTTLSLPTPLSSTNAMIGLISTARSCAYIGFAKHNRKARPAQEGEKQLKAVSVI